MVVAEGPAADALVTFMTEMVPPAVDVELVCAQEVMEGKETCWRYFIKHTNSNSLHICESPPVVVGAF